MLIYDLHWFILLRTRFTEVSDPRANTSGSTMCMCVIPQSAIKGLNCNWLTILDCRHDVLASQLVRSRHINMVEKRKQPHVLTAGLVSVRNDTWIIHEYQVYDRFYSRAFTTCQWLLVSIMCITEFTCEHYAHDRIHLWVFSYYSRVQKCMTEVTCEYFQLVSNRSRAVCFSCRTSPTRELSSKFLEAWSVTCVFL